jgi:D-alanine-D-alanine ligase-like ATP-grasp enzyme
MFIKQPFIAYGNNKGELMQNMGKQCRYCYPEEPNHRRDKFNSLFFALADYASKTIKLLLFNESWNFGGDRYLARCIAKLQKKKKLLKSDVADLSQMTYKSKLLWMEAKKRKLDIYCFSMNGRQLLVYQWNHRDKEYYYRYSPITILHKHLSKFKDPGVYDDKIFFKKFLSKNKIPHPEGRAFFSRKRALSYGKKLGFPLVVKPNSSSLSKHVTLNINDNEALKSAIGIAKMIDHRVIVERYIPGNVHRFMCINDKLLVCSKRLAASIVGDGRQTINELIDQYNATPLRGDKTKGNSPLGEVQKDNVLHEYLACQGVSLQKVLDAGKRIFLSEKTNCANGAEVINLTEKVCTENAELFRKIHNVLQVGVTAIDFICEDVSIPWGSQSFGILENNSFPDIAPQHFPSSGEPVDVAKAIWEFIIETLSETSD